MKKFAISTVLLFSALYIYPQQKQTAKERVTSIVFEIFGRRGRTEVKINTEYAISTSRTEKKFIPMTREKWDELQAAINDIDLSSIQNLKSPTSRRDVDGALHCRIFISTNKKKYESQYFDSGIPMQQLKTLYEKIEALRTAINYDGEYWKE